MGCSRKKMFTNAQLIIWNGNVYVNDNSKLNVDNLKGWNIDEKYLMQTTGLKDKNDKEIYEGDIIQNEDTGLVGSVVYINESFALDLGKTYGALYFFSLETNMCQVIGNIYDGKELLEKTK